MAKFIISTDSCADRFRSYLKSNNVHCIILKRITDGVISEELYDSDKEFDDFYESIKKGALPTTSQLNPSELEDYFLRILDEEKEGDIIHVSLSSGLSNTFNNCVLAADSVSQSSGRKVYAFDSLSATLGMGMLVDKLIELRDSGVSASEAVAKLEYIRDHQQLWAMIGNLFHLKRGGRISGFKAAVGSMLNVKPILIINNQGKLVIEKTVKGTKKSLDYLINNLVEYGIKHGGDYTKSKVYVLHSMAKEDAEILIEALEPYVAKEQIVEGPIGPIIGTHVGAGAVAIVFEGAKRLEIQ